MTASWPVFHPQRSLYCPVYINFNMRSSSDMHQQAVSPDAICMKLAASGDHVQIPPVLQDFNASLCLCLPANSVQIQLSSSLTCKPAAAWSWANCRPAIRWLVHQPHNHGDRVSGSLQDECEQMLRWLAHQPEGSMDLHQQLPQEGLDHGWICSGRWGQVNAQAGAAVRLLCRAEASCGCMLGDEGRSFQLCKLPQRCLSFSGLPSCFLT